MSDFSPETPEGRAILGRYPVGPAKTGKPGLDFRGLMRHMTSLRDIPRSNAGAPKPVAYQALPCGCVSGVYLASPDVVELELVEAKGPHCRVSGHRTGRLVGNGAVGDVQEN